MQLAVELLVVEGRPGYRGRTAQLLMNRSSCQGLLGTHQGVLSIAVHTKTSDPVASLFNIVVAYSLRRDCLHDQLIVALQ